MVFLVSLTKAKACNMVKTYDSKFPPSPNVNKVTESFDKSNNTDIFLYDIDIRERNALSTIKTFSIHSCIQRSQLHACAEPNSTCRLTQTKH